ncbi:MAG: hypothetical protein H8E44_26020 [Planctomycetes bacterium]|nr:hypothetical protein [Planctomycetota bacterium]MBL7042050.1 hypothetical protein [Pirellulaceae bacterium]
MPNVIQRCETTKQRMSRLASLGLRLVFGAVFILPWSSIVVAEDFLRTYIREQTKGYQMRPCGFDMDRNGVIGEKTDCRIGDGRTADPDGDGVDEDLIYVDAKDGSDENGNGTASAPYQTIGKALGTADGPGDGAEDIVCISGVFHETIKIPHGGVPGHYERDGFQFPKNPLMIIGWDKDGDGQYPPYDKDDVAVLDGQGQLDVAVDTISEKHNSYLEIAHLTIRDYGYRERVKSGGFKLFYNGGLESHVYIHDVELYNINRGHCCLRNHSNSIVLSFWGHPFTDVAFINNKVQDFGAYFCRGAIWEDGGRFRFQNNSLSMDPGKETGKRRSASGWKLWGRFNDCRILDNVIDMNARAWSSLGFAAGVKVCEGTRDWMIQGNVLIDLGVALQSFAAGYPGGRPIDNIVIDRNLFWMSYADRAKLPTAVNIEGHVNAPKEETVKNVTISNNMMYSAVGWGPAAIRCTAGNKSAPQDGTIRIVGNTMYGAAREGMLVIRPRTAFKHNDFVVRNNIFHATSGPKRQIVVNYRPTGFHSDGNVYNVGGTFAWGGGSPQPFRTWRDVTGQDNASKTGAPLFMAAETGDLHLSPSDTVAIGTGVALECTSADFDGDLRSARPPVSGADVPISADAGAKREVDTRPTVTVSAP